MVRRDTKRDDKNCPYNMIEQSRGDANVYPYPSILAWREESEKEKEDAELSEHHRRTVQAVYRLQRLLFVNLPHQIHCHAASDNLICTGSSTTVSLTFHWRGPKPK